MSNFSHEAQTLQLWGEEIFSKWLDGWEDFPKWFKSIILFVFWTTIITIIFPLAVPFIGLNDGSIYNGEILQITSVVFNYYFLALILSGLAFSPFWVIYLFRLLFWKDELPIKTYKIRTVLIIQHIISLLLGTISLIYILNSWYL